MQIPLSACLLVDLLTKEMAYRPVSMSNNNVGAGLQGLGEIHFRLAYGLLHAVSTSQHCGDGRRQGAARAVSIECIHGGGRKFRSLNAVIVAYVKIVRFGSSLGMPALYQQSLHAKAQYGLRRLVDRTVSAGQRPGLRQVWRNDVGHGQQPLFHHLQGVSLHQGAAAG